MNESGFQHDGEGEEGVDMPLPTMGDVGNRALYARRRIELWKELRRLREWDERIQLGEID